MHLAGHSAVTGYAENKLALLLPSMLLLLLLLRVSDRRSACSANESEKLRSHKCTHTHTQTDTLSHTRVGVSDSQFWAKRIGKLARLGRASHRIAAPCDSFDLYVTFYFRYVVVAVGEHFLLAM